jgi:hypothetical protein
MDTHFLLHFYLRQQLATYARSRISTTLFSLTLLPFVEVWPFRYYHNPIVQQRQGP